MPLLLAAVLHLLELGLGGALVGRALGGVTGTHAVLGAVFGVALDLDVVLDPRLAAVGVLPRHGAPALGGVPRGGPLDLGVRVLLGPVAVGLAAVVVVGGRLVLVGQPSGHAHEGQAAGADLGRLPAILPAVGADLTGHHHRGPAGPGGDGGEPGQGGFGQARGVGVTVGVGASRVDGVLGGFALAGLVLRHRLDVLDHLVQAAARDQRALGLVQRIQVLEHGGRVLAGLDLVVELARHLVGGLVTTAGAHDQRLEQARVVAVGGDHVLALGRALAAVVVGHHPVHLELARHLTRHVALLGHAQVAAHQEGGGLGAALARDALGDAQRHRLLVVVGDGLARAVHLGPQGLHLEAGAELEDRTGGGGGVSRPVARGLGLGQVLAQVPHVSHHRCGDAVLGPGADELAHGELFGHGLHRADVVHVAVSNDHGVDPLDPDLGQIGRQALAREIPAGVDEDVLAAERLHQRRRPLTHIDVVDLDLLGRCSGCAVNQQQAKGNGKGADDGACASHGNRPL